MHPLGKRLLGRPREQREPRYQGRNAGDRFEELAPIHEVHPPLVNIEAQYCRRVAVVMVLCNNGRRHKTAPRNRDPRGGIGSPPTPRHDCSPRAGKEAEDRCMLSHSDAIVIGPGKAGPSLAARLCGAGMSVAIIERHRFGGTCVNTGCIPTKTMIASAYVAQTARRASTYGVNLGGAVTVDMKAVHARKDAISQGSSRDLEDWLRH